MLLILSIEAPSSVKINQNYKYRGNFYNLIYLGTIILNVFNLTLFSFQFLEDNPMAVLDASFLSSLNEMACRLVQVR